MRRIAAKFVWLIVFCIFGVVLYSFYLANNGVVFYGFGRAVWVAFGVLFLLVLLALRLGEE